MADMETGMQPSDDDPVEMCDGDLLTPTSAADSDRAVLMDEINEVGKATVTLYCIHTIATQGLIVYFYFIVVI